MDKKVTIIGVGALGSHVALLLRNEAQLKLIDYDRVERKNVLAQFHGATTAGKNKAQALQSTLAFLFGVKAQAVPHKLTTDNCAQLLGGTDLLIDCLDNAPSRALVQEYARANGIACLHGALAADGAFGRVVWDERFQIDGAAVGAATCEGGEHLPFIAEVSSLLARSAQLFLKENRRVGFEIPPLGAIIT